MSEFNLRLEWLGRLTGSILLTTIPSGGMLALEIAKGEQTMRHAKAAILSECNSHPAASRSSR
jgi:hypothetical protein